jgi:hypothetical protein
MPVGWQPVVWIFRLPSVQRGSNAPSPVSFRIVKAPAAGVVPPIGVELIVELISATPLRTVLLAQRTTALIRNTIPNAPSVFETDNANFFIKSSG